MNFPTSFDETGWSPNMVDMGRGKLLAGKNEFVPKVYSTKSSRRCTFVGGSSMDGTDLPQYGGLTGRWDQ